MILKNYSQVSFEMLKAVNKVNGSSYGRYVLLLHV